MGLKRKPIKKTKATIPAARKRKCDRIWALIVKTRAKGICEFCLNPGADSHHMVSRTSMFLRHDVRNGVYLCKRCHFHFHRKESFTLWEWFEKTRPDDFLHVAENRHQIQKKTDFDVVEMRLSAWEKEFGDS